MRTLSACLSQPVVAIVLQVTDILSRIDFTHTRGSRLEHIIVSCPKSSHLIAQCHTLHLTWALHLAHALLPWHKLPHFPRILFLVTFNPAPIYVNLSVVWFIGGTSHPWQVMSSKIIGISRKTSISLNTRILPNTRIYVSNTFFHQPTYDSAERIATPPPDSDLDDDQIRALLASPLYLQEREANAERSQVYHHVRENLMSSSSQDPISMGRPGALLFSSKNRLNPETFSDREYFSLGHQQVLGNNAPLFTCSNPVTSVKSIQDIESICSGKLSDVPSQPAVVSSPLSMLSRDQSTPPDSWNLCEPQGNAFGNPRHMLDSSQMPYQGILHSTHQSATGGIPVQRITGRPVARGEERIGSTIPRPMFAGRPSTMNSSHQRRYHRIFFGCTAKSANIGLSVC